MKMHYNPANEELVLITHPVIGTPSKKVDHFKFWYDDEGNIYALAITNYSEELKEFLKKSQHYTARWSPEGCNNY
jgi:hypothetical protein